MPGAVSNHLSTPRRRTLSHRGGANAEVGPERSKIKWLPSGLSRGLSKNRGIITLSCVLEHQQAQRNLSGQTHFSSFT